MRLQLILRDVAQALGYSSTPKAIQMHVDDEDKTTLPIWDTASNYKTEAVSAPRNAIATHVDEQNKNHCIDSVHWFQLQVHVDEEGKTYTILPHTFHPAL